MWGGLLDKAAAVAADLDKQVNSAVGISDDDTPSEASETVEFDNNATGTATATATATTTEAKDGTEMESTDKGLKDDSSWSATSEVQLVKHATTENEISNCAPILLGLRPQHKSEKNIIEQIQYQRVNHAYEVIYIVHPDCSNSNDEVDANGRKNIVACAGYFYSHSLGYGKTLFVEDLIVVEAERNKGYGTQLLQFLTDEAKNKECRSLRLNSEHDSHVAQKFFLRHGFDIVSHHLALEL